jgi:hypothetical protein
MPVAQICRSDGLLKEGTFPGIQYEVNAFLLIGGRQHDRTGARESG